MREPADIAMRKLFQAAGHHTPGTDLTARIMARVAVTPMAHPTKVEPLIGRTGWTLLLAPVIVLITVTVVAAMRAPAGDVPDYLAPMLEVVRNVRIPASWAMWSIGITGCLLLFTWMDRVLARRSTSSRT
jgi:hypothetical protein